MSNLTTYKHLMLLMAAGDREVQNEIMGTLQISHLTSLRHVRHIFPTSMVIDFHDLMTHGYLNPRPQLPP